MSDEKTKSIVSNDGVIVKESTRKNRLNNLLEKANTLPKNSGCYFMKNKDGAVIYVGKAKNLKSRVTSYFNSSAKSPKTLILVSHIREFDFILTNSDAESFVLENNLIKEYRPKYNIRLKDDKSYPYVSVSFKHDFPKINYIRRPKRQTKNQLFGPFPVGSNISRVIKLLTKSFSLRDCSDHEFNTRKVPCMLYQMKQCSAPCVDLISKKDYESDLEQAMNFFKGRNKSKATLDLLRERMMNFAQNEEFERAAQSRDYIEELISFNEKSFDQNVEGLSDRNLDVISYYQGEEEIDISLYFIREGNLLGHKNFNFLCVDLLDEPETEVMSAMLQYYAQSNDVIPEKVVTCFKSERIEQFESALKQILGNDVKLKVQGSTKKYASLIEVARNNAIETQRVRLQNQDSVFVGLNRLKDLLKMGDRPKTLECYDIAVWQGKSPTASQVVFYEGKPDKASYRHYHMQERPEGNNDFAMMTEVFERRLKHGNFPDAFVVDGGIQQVNTVKKVLEQFNLDIPLVGIAKARSLSQAAHISREIKNSEERLIIPGRSNPYTLNKCPSLMRILVQMRDEAHRFSRVLHHKTEKKRIVKTWIDEVKGLNQKVREQVLITNALSVEELTLMNISELQGYLGVSQKHARDIYDHLHAKNL